MALKTVWQNKIENIFATKPQKDEDLFLEIISMFIYQRESDDISTLYNEVGLESFINLLGMLGGSTITLPTQKELKEAIFASLCFYYKNMKGKTWEEIHHLMPFTEYNAVSHGIAVAKLEKDIVKRIQNNFEKIDNNSKGGVDEIREWLK